ncbi:MAG: DUF1344 domain-containing protein [Paracoccaceae bacterium]
MRIQLYSAALLAAMFAGGVAQAEQTTGQVKSVDPVAMTITLEDGTVYTVQPDSKDHTRLTGYLPGDTVTLEWAMDGDKHLASAVSAETVKPVTGKVKSVDMTAHSVTLDDGMVYTFNADESHLGGLQAGDSVSILADTSGAGTNGRSIEVGGTHTVTGIVKTVDPASGKVTLMDSTVYTFDKDTAIDGFKAGDNVTISADDVGGTHQGLSIGSAG